MKSFPDSAGWKWRVAVAALLALLVSATAGITRVEAAEPGRPMLKAETRAAFQRYTMLTDARNQAELENGGPFLWVDGLPGGQRDAAYAELKNGAVKIEKLETLDHGQRIDVPYGLVHHWVGIVFIPKAKLDDVLGILEDYNHHASYYAPDVEESRIEAHDGSHFRVFLRFRRRKVITVVLDTVHDVTYFRDTAQRAHSRSSAIRIAEVENPGESDEREKPPGDDDGFLWGMETWWRMEERDGGVYVQSEVASLTRTIPTGLGWLVGPFVTSIPKESLTFTLEATRRAVEAPRR